MFPNQDWTRGYHYATPHKLDWPTRKRAFDWRLAKGSGRFTIELSENCGPRSKPAKDVRWDSRIPHKELNFRSWEFKPVIHFVANPAGIDFRESYFGLDRFNDIVQPDLIAASLSLAASNFHFRHFGVDQEEPKNFVILLEKKSSDIMPGHIKNNLGNEDYFVFEDYLSDLSLLKKNEERLQKLTFVKLVFFDYANNKHFNAEEICRLFRHQCVVASEGATPRRIEFTQTEFLAQSLLGRYETEVGQSYSSPSQNRPQQQQTTIAAEAEASLEHSLGGLWKPPSAQEPERSVTTTVTNTRKTVSPGFSLWAASTPVRCEHASDDFTEKAAALNISTPSSGTRSPGWLENELNSWDEAKQDIAEDILRSMCISDGDGASAALKYLFDGSLNVAETKVVYEFHHAKKAAPKPKRFQVRE